ncbi:hypothetical protein [Glaciihabitans sp. UYNi722]|uniref:hypothetical protein n=1 Tax=Glaciihabitans sp. UYNi722 TaxID=3156344 RepID=UPI003393101D
MVSLVEKIAQSVSSLGVKASYGDAVTVDGVELIPVALTWFGFGAGGDDSDKGGGGGGGASIPIGAYVGGPEGPRFQPNVIAFLAVSIPFTWVAGKALVRLVKALKR